MSSGSNVRLSHLMHATVQSTDGKSLGHVNDLIVDPQSGRIEFAIVSLSSSGGSSDTSTSGSETVPSSRSSNLSSQGMTGKMIPVPWQLFSQSWNGQSQSSSSQSSSATSGSSSSSMGSQTLTLNVDEAKLRSAPSFDAANWSELQGGSMDQRVYSYFGVDKSSGLGTSGSSISGQGSSGSSGSSSHQHHDSSSSGHSGTSSSSGSSSQDK